MIPNIINNNSFAIKQQERLEEKKREQMEIIERQKAANIRVNNRGNCCYCQNCNKRVKMHPAEKITPVENEWFKKYEPS
jgi:hypothetical protein